MNSITKTTSNEVFDLKEEIRAFLQSDFTEDELVEIKKDEIATDLICLMNQAKLKRSQLSEHLNMPKSRITKILSGRENLTVKTIFLYARRLGFDFDVIFRHHTTPRNLQPWQLTKIHHQTDNFLNQNFTIKTKFQVEKDIRNGTGSRLYLCFNREIDDENEIKEEKKSLLISRKNKFDYLNLFKANSDVRKLHKEIKND